MLNSLMSDICFEKQLYCGRVFSNKAVLKKVLLNVTIFTCISVPQPEWQRYLQHFTYRWKQAYLFFPTQSELTLLL